MKKLLQALVFISFMLATQVSIGFAASQLGLNPYFLCEVDKAVFKECMSWGISTEQECDKESRMAVRHYFTIMQPALH